jgi:hypothetical protein
MLPDPTGRYFQPGLDFFEDRLQLSGEDGSSGGRNLRAFAVHTFVMPAVLIGPHREDPSLPWPSTTIQEAAIGSAGIASLIATVVWLVLLANGFIGVLSDLARRHRLAVAGLLLTLVGQLGLHLVWGTEAFLYSLHWAPLLVVVAALGARGRLRTVVVAAAAVLAIALGWSHIGQFTRLASIVRPDPSTWSVYSVID